MVENRMGYEPVPKLILKMSCPMMISMLIQALYNVVDSIFVAQVSESALTAVSLAYPFQLLIVAVAVGTAIGLNSLMSRRLGEQKPEEARKAAANGLFLALLGSIFFLLFGLFLSGPVMDLFLPSESLAGTAEYIAQVESVELGKVYLRICMVFGFGIVFQLTFERIIMSTGNTVLPMIITLIGAIINLIGDPILIFGWFGLPAMGVAGAAIATVAGQIIAMIVGAYFVFRKKAPIKVKLSGFRPSGGMIKQIYKVGISSILMQSLGSVVTFCLNAILMTFSATAVSVLGIYFKIQSFIFMPVFGMNAGVLAIFGYNFGARKKERIKQTYRTCILYALVIMIVGVAIFQLFPEFLLGLFDASEQMLVMGVPALRIISIHFPLAAVCIMSLTLFQGVGRGFYSLLCSLIRQAFAILPAAYILAKLVGLEGVWYCYPIAECIAFIFSIIVAKRVFKKDIEPLEEIRPVAAAE